MLISTVKTWKKKRKFSTTDQLNKAARKVMAIAWDISEHFCDNWQRTGFKGHLVAQDKATALAYKKYLDEFAMVSSEALISTVCAMARNSGIFWIIAGFYSLLSRQTISFENTARRESPGAADGSFFEMELPDTGNREKAKALMHGWYSEHARDLLLRRLAQYMPTFGRMGAGFQMK